MATATPEALPVRLVAFNRRSQRQNVRDGTD